jgi:hypothetical protein
MKYINPPSVNLITFHEFSVTLQSLANCKDYIPEMHHGWQDCGPFGKLGITGTAALVNTHQRLSKLPVPPLLTKILLIISHQK